MPTVRVCASSAAPAKREPFDGSEREDLWVTLGDKECGGRTSKSHAATGKGRAS
jgi:hypothetical protein